MYGSARFLINLGGKLWHRALGAKGCHPDQRFCRWKLLFYQQPCAKAKEFGEAEFWDSMPVFYGGILYWLLEKQGKLYFLQSSQTKGRGVLLRLVTPVLSAAVCKSSRIRHSPNSGTVRRFPVLPTPCAKTREFGEAEFSDCLPVSASVCVFAFDTGGLGLWLGAFGRSRLYRCQSRSFRPSRRRVEGSCIGFWKSKANSTFCKVVKI